MNTAYGKGLGAALAALVLTSVAVTPVSDAAGRFGGGGGGGGGGRHGGGGGVQAREHTQINNSRADVRTNNVRNTSVNNVNVNRNVNVDVDRHGGCCYGGGWDRDYHPVATAAAVTATAAVTAAVVGSVVRSVPPSCVPVNYGGMIYQQCGSTWYLPQGSQYLVVDPPY
jgi:hypothetical protein